MWLHIAQSTTSFDRTPGSPSKMETFLLPKMVAHAVGMQCKKPLALRLGDVTQANHRMQQPFKWHIWLSVSHPKPGFNADL